TGVVGGPPAAPGRGGVLRRLGGVGRAAGPPGLRVGAGRNTGVPVRAPGPTPRRGQRGRAGGRPETEVVHGAARRPGAWPVARRPAGVGRLPARPAARPRPRPAGAREVDGPVSSLASFPRGGARAEEQGVPVVPSGGGPRREGPGRPRPP